jgi:hypothetical protein
MQVELAFTSGDDSAPMRSICNFEAVAYAREKDYNIRYEKKGGISINLINVLRLVHKRMLYY